jgi:hypothetical protein
MADTSEPVTLSQDDCQYESIENDPDWVRGLRLLKWLPSEDYGGIVLKGQCPHCQHADGIDVFIPTIWATSNGSLAQATSVSFEVTAVNVAEDLVNREHAGPPAEGHPNSLTEIVVCCCSWPHKNTPAGKSGCGRWGYIPIPGQLEAANAKRTRRSPVLGRESR